MPPEQVADDVEPYGKQTGNYYMTILCEAGSDADTISEAYRLAAHCGRTVQLHRCGSQKLLYRVFPDGGVVPAKP